MLRREEMRWRLKRRCKIHSEGFGKDPKDEEQAVILPVSEGS
jgi:hypothetical protein